MRDCRHNRRVTDGSPALPGSGQAPADVPMGYPSAADRTGLRVLIVEDDRAHAQYLETALTLTEGWRTTVVGCLSDALAELTAVRYDAILLDLGLPDSRPAATFRAMRKASRDAPIVVLTGLEDHRLGVQAVQEGAQDYLVKGKVQADALAGAIEYAIERQRIVSHLARELHSSEARLRTIVDSNKDGLAVVDRHGVIRFANPGAKRILDREPDELVGQPFGLLLADRDGVEIEIARRDGQVSVAEMRVANLDWAGEPARLVSLRDVTEHKRLLKDLETTRRKQLEMKDQFLSHVSHELRSPLAAMIQFVGIMLDGIAGEVTPDQREYLEIVHRNGCQLRAMIDDLLEATRVETGKLSLDPQGLGLDEIIDEAVSTLRTAAEQKAIALTARVDPRLPLVYADPRRLRAILHNLIDNAVKFTGEHGAIVVEGQVSPEDPAFLQIAVRDTGCGITPDGVSRVFDRFFQDENYLEESRQGLGLGLYICRELVVAHGGRIWVNSELGQGSAFQFTLPVYSNEHDREASAALALSRRPTDSSLRTS